MDNARTPDKQVTGYLKQLSPHNRKSLISLIARRNKELESKDVIGESWEDVKKRARLSTISNSGNS
jgi:hypothetical protein